MGILVDYTGGSIGASFTPDAPYTDSSSPVVQTYADRFLEQIEPVYPGISSHYTGRASLSVPARDPNLLGSYSCWLVGQYTLFSGFEGVRQGNIHFAGEHCSTNFQGFMEGGAEEGARAAGEILSDYKNGSFP
jgi:monoamine oxidase